jgi:hypothetical protein
MLGADIVRSEHTPSCIIPAFGQVSENSLYVSVSKQAWDVFQERESRSYDAKALDSFGPHISGVVSSFLFSGDAKRLAGESCCNDINQSLIFCGVPFTDECSDIAEDRGVVEYSVFNSLDDNFLAVVFFFDISNVPPSKYCCSK